MCARLFPSCVGVNSFLAFVTLGETSFAIQENDVLENHRIMQQSLFIPGFLTLPTAYVTGNPVECVLHPRLWNTTSLWDPLGVGHIYQDEYEEDNVGYQLGTVSDVDSHKDLLEFRSFLGRMKGSLFAWVQYEKIVYKVALQLHKRIL